MIKKTKTYSYIYKTWRSEDPLIYIAWIGRMVWYQIIWTSKSNVNFNFVDRDDTKAYRNRSKLVII